MSCKIQTLACERVYKIYEKQSLLRHVVVPAAIPCAS